MKSGENLSLDLWVAMPGIEVRCATNMATIAVGSPTSLENTLGS